MPAPYRLMLLTRTPAPPVAEGYVHEAKLPELGSLAGLGDVVLDGEMVVATPDGRADFELLTTRLNRRPGDPTPAQRSASTSSTSCATSGEDLRDRPWSERRTILDKLELAEHTAGIARPTVVSPDGNAMHQATAAIGAEATSVKTSGPFTGRAGPDAGSRPSTPGSTRSRWAAGGPPPPPDPAG